MKFRSVLALAVACTAALAVAPAPELTAPIGFRIFPATNWWYQNVSQAPIDPHSSAIIDWINGRTAATPTAVRPLHADFGPPPYGFPYAVVSADQPRVRVHFSPYGSQSDTGINGLEGYPVPEEAKTDPNYIEGGAAGSSDRHMLLIDRDRRLLYETFRTVWNASLNRWEAASGAIFDLSRNDRRPEGWTSADASGLAMFPGLVRYDEAAAASDITHAFRVTLRATNGYVWPASHESKNSAGAPPLGTRLRLKATKSLSGYSPELQRIFRAMQQYGLIVADNGPDMSISGTMDSRWSSRVLVPAFNSLTADDFDVIQLGWKPAVTLSSPSNLRIIRP